ncbi:MAG: hypothetical protein LBD88_04215 [Candidatus Peribacteria bacterium]|jgi:hypothetical protein|nr:hypothetical protein [Candidatus Peribacteria bacterium]
MRNNFILQNDSEETPKNTKASNEKKITTCDLIKEKFEEFKSRFEKEEK